MLDPYTSFAARKRAVLMTSVVLLLLVMAVVIRLTMASGERTVASEVVTTVAGTIAVVGVARGLSAYQNLVEQQVREQKIETVEGRLREHPEKPQLAWDLARTKLENYLDRNLSQVRSIYWLTLIVMLCGFGFVMFGLFQASHNPEKLPVSIVASASGVL